MWRSGKSSCCRHGNNVVGCFSWLEDTYHMLLFLQILPKILEVPLTDKDFVPVPCSTFSVWLYWGNMLVLLRHYRCLCCLFRVHLSDWIISSAFSVVFLYFFVFYFWAILLTWSTLNCCWINLMLLWLLIKKIITLHLAPSRTELLCFNKSMGYVGSYTGNCLKTQNCLKVLKAFK